MSDYQSTWHEVAVGTQRLRVPGGWIYRCYHAIGGVALVFVAEPPSKEER